MERFNTNVHRHETVPTGPVCMTPSLGTNDQLRLYRGSSGEGRWGELGETV
jgi:hypothetical protein